MPKNLYKYRIALVIYKQKQDLYHRKFGPDADNLDAYLKVENKRTGESGDKPMEDDLDSLRVEFETQQSPDLQRYREIMTEELLFTDFKKALLEDHIQSFN